jgi:hypothetical protein
MIIENKEVILQYIPQRDPIIMVDHLVEIINDKMLTQLTVHKENYFCTINNKVNFYGVIEHIAQSYALVDGYLYGKCIGMIGRITKLQTYFEPNIEEIINTELTVMNNMNNLVLISAVSFQNKSKIISCEMYLHFNR